MNRTKLSDRKLPTYTKGEENFNMVSHIVGGAIGIAALPLCIIIAAINGNIAGVVSGAIYGVTLILLYSMSSIYHGLSPKFTAKKILQIIDHCSIFILIAGTYTPYSLCTLMKYKTWVGWTVFGVIWSLAVLGIVFNSIDLKKYSIFSMICYLGMGWCIVFFAKPLANILTFGGTALLVAGGVSYTVGALFYGIGKKKKFMHSVFHLFVVIGSVLHFLSIIIYVMPY